MSDTAMELRKLQTKDARNMLEWMHDDAVVRYFKKRFELSTIEDCIEFISKAQDETESIHLAIVDDNDEYMGTASLKHIQDGRAELGIAVRDCAMGDGYSAFGINAIMQYGYRNRGIDTVYWCVDPGNLRALRFYDKNEYSRYDAPSWAVGYTEEEKQKYIWYITRM